MTANGGRMMGLRGILHEFKSKLAGLARARRINSLVFSGAPVLLHINRSMRGGRPVWSLLFKNGLMLTVGEAGILDYQDRDFSHFMGERDLLNREFLVQLHKIVLKTLVKYLVHPRLDAEQRDRAAEAASHLYLAGDRPVAVEAVGMGAGFDSA